MRLWNLGLIAYVFIFAMAGSAQAQRIQRPALAAAATYWGNRPTINRTSSAARISTYNTDGHRYPYVIALPEDRQWIRETPIELRPNRPMHFWGNSRRRTLR